MKSIAQTAVEPIPAQQSFIFHVPDHRLDGAAPLDVSLEPAGDTPSHPATPNLHAWHFRALIAFVDKDRLRFLIRENRYLLDSLP